MNENQIKIVKAEIHKLALKLRMPFVTGFGKIENKTTILLKLTDESGVVGWSEAATLPLPMYIPESTDTAIVSLEKYLLPKIINKSLTHPEDLLEYYGWVKGWNLSKAAIENAVWEIYATKMRSTAGKLLGGTRSVIDVGCSIGMRESILETLKIVDLCLKSKYKRVKLKIKPGFDYEIVKAVRDEFGGIDLMVDANSAYNLDQVNLIRKLDEFDLMMIEQPLSDTDIIDHATLQKAIKTPICLDESILSLDDARKAIEIGACQIINIKQARVGGLSESKKIHDLCTKNDVGVWCGGMLELGVGKHINTQIATLPNFIYPADMSDPLEIYEEDVLDGGLKIIDGQIKVDMTADLNSMINIDKVERLSVCKIIL